MKGLKALITSGSVRNDPASIAAFLMEHSALLDKTQLGELFGHHEDREVTWVPWFSTAAGSASPTTVVKEPCLVDTRPQRVHQAQVSTAQHSRTA